MLVSDLDPQVTEEDVIDIFTNVGEVKDAIIYYDRDGRSLGTSEVTFLRKNDALKAVEEYDGAEVDGRPMYLKLIAAPKPVVVVKNRPTQPVQQYNNFSNGGQQGRRRGRGAGGSGSRGGGRGRGRGRGRGGRGRRESEKPKSAEELDADMDNYFSQSSSEKKAEGKSTEAAASAGQPAVTSAAGQPAAPE